MAAEVGDMAIALKAGFKLYDGFSVKTTQLFQRHNCANFADFGDKTKITSALNSFLLQSALFNVDTMLLLLAELGNFFNILFLKSMVVTAKVMFRTPVL